MAFKKYMHIERFGNDEVQGIEIGECYVFPKVDGTNGSVWGDDDGIHTGSRRRELSIAQDNAGFHHFVLGNDALKNMAELNKNLRFFGEWLVPHSLKTYRDDAWRRFYIFDVFNDGTDEYLSYPEYSEICKKFGVDFIPPLCIMRNATYDNLLVELGNNFFLVRDGEGCGEGIVIKNYRFQNQFGRTVWAKIITNRFKEKHSREQPTVKKMAGIVEQKICDEYITLHLAQKVYAKIANEMGGWNNKYIPRLLQTVFYDFVNEEIWSVVKNLKHPTINFKTLYSMAILRVKELLPEIF